LAWVNSDVIGLAAAIIMLAEPASKRKEPSLLQAQTGRVYKPSFTASSSLQPKTPHSSSSHATIAAQAPAVNAVWQSPEPPRPRRACTATAWCGPRRRSRRGARRGHGSGPAHSPPARPRHTCNDAAATVHALTQPLVHCGDVILRKPGDQQVAHAAARGSHVHFTLSRRQQLFAPGWTACFTPAEHACNCIHRITP